MQIYKNIGHLTSKNIFSECGSNWSTNLPTFIKQIISPILVFSGKPSWTWAGKGLWSAFLFVHYCNCVSLILYVISLDISTGEVV